MNPNKRRLQKGQKAYEDFWRYHTTLKEEYDTKMSVPNAKSDTISIHSTASYVPNKEPESDKENKMDSSDSGLAEGSSEKESSFDVASDSRKSQNDDKEDKEDGDAFEQEEKRVSTQAPNKTLQVKSPNLNQKKKVHGHFQHTQKVPSPAKTLLEAQGTRNVKVLEAPRKQKRKTKAWKTKMLFFIQRNQTMKEHFWLKVRGN
jgi:hypothetical protein